MGLTKTNKKQHKTWGLVGKKYEDQMGFPVLIWFAGRFWTQKGMTKGLSREI
jgi:hypothetical protein